MRDLGWVAHFFCFKVRKFLKRSGGVFLELKVFLLYYCFLPLPEPENMKLEQDIHLAYCTNVHRGNTWEETFRSLETDVLSVREQVCPDQAYAIGLRLGAAAAAKLREPEELLAFQKWLEVKNCYVFTINGFPYGEFHGTRVKEQVYRPDWTSKDRLDYTIVLFEILEHLLQPGEEGSVSTLPGSFKEFISPDSIPEILFENLVTCSQKIESLQKSKQLDLHLGLEPEPLGLFETCPESIAFFASLLERCPEPDLLLSNLGINYDCCHLAVEGEEAKVGLNALEDAGIRLSKLHLSSALSTTPDPEKLETLKSFIEEVYLHQVVIHQNGKVLERIKDLDLALEKAKEDGFNQGDEWRIHFHVPLHASPGNGLADTGKHVLDTLDWLASKPEKCKHLEMETYTWEVLPEALRAEKVVDQIAKEYQWTLQALTERGIQKVSST